MWMIQTTFFSNSYGPLWRRVALCIAPRYGTALRSTSIKQGRFLTDSARIPSYVFLSPFRLAGLAIGRGAVGPLP